MHGSPSVGDGVSEHQPGVQACLAQKETLCAQYKTSSPLVLVDSLPHASRRRLPQRFHNHRISRQFGIHVDDQTNTPTSLSLFLRKPSVRRWGFIGSVELFNQRDLLYDLRLSVPCAAPAEDPLLAVP